MVDMIETDPASDEAWSRDWRERVHAWYATLGTPAAAEAFCRGWTTAQPRLLGLLVEEGERIGHVAACVPTARDGGDPISTVIDIWVEPRHRGRGHGRLARDYAKAWAAERVGKFGVQLWGDDAGAAALFASLPLRNQRMIKSMGAEPDLPAGLHARAMSEGEYAAWRADEIAGYAADLSDSGTLTPEQAWRVSADSYDEMLPGGLATPGNDWSVIEAHGVGVATIWLGHDEDRDIGFVYSVEVRPEQRGKGYGRAAMLAGEAMSIRAGYTHLGLNVFGHNTVAIGLYESLGYALLEQSRFIDVA